MKTRFKLTKYLAILAIAATLFLAIKSPTIPAERIDFNYSLLGFKIQVQDLEIFAKTGSISNSLNFYLKRISPKQTTQLRKFLNQSYDVDPVLVYRYSRTEAGIKMLDRIGGIIRLPGGLNGFYGLRAAVVQTAELETDTNLINFLKQFPTDINLNLGGIINLVKQMSQSEKDTQEFIASIENKTAPKPKLKDVADLSQPGKYKFTQQTLKLRDKKRDRNLNTDLYLPQINANSIPVIVVSNGLGAKRDRFQQLASHLASHGFAVAIPDHPGSDRQRQKDFVRGLYQENFDGTDYIDRPLDISYILDELEVFNQQLDNRLNLGKVGIFGYSIGGTTALSLAGANIDFDRLETECDRPLDLFNISTLYQCRALAAARDRQPLKDERIAAGFMFVPFGNLLFSQAELKKVTIPMMWQVVDRDFLTSLLNEQVPLFDSLTNSSRYMVISEKLPHSNVTLSKEQQLKQAETFAVAKNYQNILSLVFFQDHLTEEKYGDYLNPEYIKAIEQQPYKLHLVTKRGKGLK